MKLSLGHYDFITTWYQNCDLIQVIYQTIQLGQFESCIEITGPKDKQRGFWR